MRHFRRAEAEDVVAVRNLSRAAYAKWVPLIGREPWPMVADYDVSVQAHVIDLLYDDDVLVGLIEMISGEGHLLIENVAVGPSHQGRGHGRHLMAHAEEFARTRNDSEIRLYTNQLFAANIALYQRLGYSVDREEVVSVGVVVHLKKSISTK